MRYLLDANIFIQAKNLHYSFDFCPAFWEWLIENNKLQKVFSIEKVGDEINAGDNELAKWASERNSDFFLKPDKKVSTQFPKVSEWASEQNYEQAAINTFLQVADYYLITHALLTDSPLLPTKSLPTPRRKSRFPMPVKSWGSNLCPPMKCCATNKRGLYWEGIMDNSQFSISRYPLMKDS